MVAVAAVWILLPRQPLPPQRVGTILDRATTGNFVTFNDSEARNTLLLSTGTDIWEIPSGKSVYQGPNLGVYISSDGRTVGRASDLFNWEAKTGINLETPPPQQLHYQLLKFSGDDAFVAASRANGSLYVLDSKTGRIKHTLRVGLGTPDPNSGLPLCDVTSLAFAPNGSLLASGEANGNISIWKLTTGDLIQTLHTDDSLSCDSGAPSPGRRNSVYTVAFSRNGKMLASVDSYGVIRIWQTSSGSVVLVLPFNFRPRNIVKFSPDGRFLVTSGNHFFGQIITIYTVWDVANGQFLRAVGMPGAGAFDFSPAGELIVAQILNRLVSVANWTSPERCRIPLIRKSVAPMLSDDIVLNAYEEQAILQLNLLQNRIGSYVSRTGNSSFPQKLDDGVEIDRGWRSDGQRLGYKYTYMPGPADNLGHITTYTVSATPLLYQQTGKRRFRVDQTGQTRATEENRDATEADAVFRTLTATVIPSEPQKSDADVTPATAPKAEVSANPPAPVRPAQAATPNPPSGPAIASQVNQLFSRAQSQFEQSDYAGALQSCDAALRLDLGNEKVRDLKAKVENTMRILGKSPNGEGSSGTAPPSSGTSAGGVFRVGGDVSAPTLIRKVDPKYSDEARRARIQGPVVLEAIVQRDGTVQVLRVVRSLGKGLDEKAVEALSQWRFNPAKQNGVAVPVALNIEVNFNLH